MAVFNPFGATKAELRTEIDRLKTENESLKVQLTTALSNTGEAKANAKLSQEYAAYKEHVKRCLADFDAGVQRIHKEAIAEAERIHKTALVIDGGTF